MTGMAYKPSAANYAWEILNTSSGLQMSFGIRQTTKLPRYSGCSRHEVLLDERMGDTDLAVSLVYHLGRSSRMLSSRLGWLGFGDTRHGMELPGNIPSSIVSFYQGSKRRHR